MQLPTIKSIFYITKRSTALYLILITVVTFLHESSLYQCFRDR